MQEAIQNISQNETVSIATEQAPTKSVANKLTNFWLALNLLVIVLTLICTAVLVAWPIVAKFAAGP